MNGWKTGLGPLFPFPWVKTLLRKLRPRKHRVTSLERVPEHLLFLRLTHPSLVCFALGNHMCVVPAQFYSSNNLVHAPFFCLLYTPSGLPKPLTSSPSTQSRIQMYKRQQKDAIQRCESRCRCLRGRDESNWIQSPQWRRLGTAALGPWTKKGANLELMTFGPGT